MVQNRYRYIIINTPSKDLDAYNDALKEYKKRKQDLLEKCIKKKKVVKKGLRFSVDLVGFDGDVKHTYNQMDVNRILNDVTAMPMGDTKCNVSLFTDDNPDETVHGLGFKDKDKALYTVEKIKNKSLKYQVQVVSTMLGRAKTHPHQTDGMRDAILVFENWLKKYHRSKKQKGGGLYYNKYQKYKQRYIATKRNQLGGSLYVRNVVNYDINGDTEEQQSVKPQVQQSVKQQVQQPVKPQVQQSVKPPVQQSVKPPVQQSVKPPVQQSAKKIVIKSKPKIDEIKVLTDVEKESDKPEYSRLYPALQYIYKAAKFGSSAAGTVLSLGAAGDTIPDVIFLVIDTSFLVGNLASLQSTNYYDKIIKPFMEINWEGDPEKVRNRTLKILDELEQTEYANILYSVLCEYYTKLLDTLAAVFASVVATLIPSDLGVSRVIIEDVITNLNPVDNMNPYYFLAWTYSKIPEKSRELLSDKKKFEEFLEGVTSYGKGFVQKYFITSDDTWEEWFGKIFWTPIKAAAAFSALMFIPGGIIIAAPAMTVAPAVAVIGSNSITGDKIVSIFEDGVEPNIPQFTDVTFQILATTFSAMVILQRCTQ